MPHAKYLNQSPLKPYLFWGTSIQHRKNHHLSPPGKICAFITLPTPSKLWPFFWFFWHIAKYINFLAKKHFAKWNDPNKTEATTGAPMCRSPAKSIDCCLALKFRGNCFLGIGLSDPLKGGSSLKNWAFFVSFGLRIKPFPMAAMKLTKTECSMELENCSYTPHMLCVRYIP